ncbi:unnamed protein product [Periconia digitata]|uniref:Uncharacterized protein n=1 Tax=Periconia digitata TaxID=1303443 RepID=A0A9W4XZ70_9PLEO|nr:unnamed protein product [Periconia digitata]
MDKLREGQELEALQTRWVGTGSEHTTPREFHLNLQRDTKASFIGHPPMLQYIATGLGLSREMTRVKLLEEMAILLAVKQATTKKAIRERSNVDKSVEAKLEGNESDD